MFLAWRTVGRDCFCPCCCCFGLVVVKQALTDKSLFLESLQSICMTYCPSVRGVQRSVGVDVGVGVGVDGG